MMKLVRWFRLVTARYDCFFTILFVINKYQICMLHLRFVFVFVNQKIELFLLRVYFSLQRWKTISVPKIEKKERKILKLIIIVLFYNILTLKKIEI